jgi:hypothetical protein
MVRLVAVMEFFINQARFRQLAQSGRNRAIDLSELFELFSSKHRHCPSCMFSRAKLCAIHDESTSRMTTATTAVPTMGSTIRDSWIDQSSRHDVKAGVSITANRNVVLAVEA